jgi:Ran GTPase-activating protein (RanGAP) involved in mRNA processing and transport
VRIINLSNNNIGAEGLQSLVKWIDGTGGRC